MGNAQATAQRKQALTAKDAVVKASEAFFDAKRAARRDAEMDLRRAVKRYRAERAYEENAKQAA
jgi:hypothetical protein